MAKKAVEADSNDATTNPNVVVEEKKKDSEKGV